jgi:hypothetical protein
MARGSAALAAAVALAHAPAVLGCAARTPHVASGQGAVPAVDADALEAEFRPLIEAHNARVAKLEALEAKGVVEVRFREDGAEKREQLDLDLRLASAGRGYLRLTKLSTDFATVGSDGKRAWIFDLSRKPAVATVFEVDSTDVETAAARALASGEIEVLSPASLRFMMGLTPIPADATIVALRTDAAASAGNAGEATASPRATHGVAWRRSSITTTLAFGADGLPGSITLADPSGALLATSGLSAYESARVDNLSQLAWPQVATRIRAEAPASGASAQFKIERPEAQQRLGKAKLFDLDALIGHYRPESVEYLLRDREDAGDADDSAPSGEPSKAPAATPAAATAAAPERTTGSSSTASSNSDPRERAKP